MEKKYNNVQRVGAILLLILLAACIIGTVIAGFSGASRDVLMAFVFADVAVPVTIYAFLLITRNIKKKTKNEEE